VLALACTARRGLSWLPHLRCCRTVVPVVAPPFLLQAILFSSRRGARLVESTLGTARMYLTLASDVLALGDLLAALDGSLQRFIDDAIAAFDDV
jgi:hypothetical protein